MLSASHGLFLLILSIGAEVGKPIYTDEETEVQRIMSMVTLFISGGSRIQT